MSRTRWLAIVAGVVVTAVIVGAVLGSVLRGPVATGAPLTTDRPSMPSTARPTLSPVPPATPGSTATPAPTATPTPTPAPTPRPTAAGDARALYVAFLRRLDADRSTVTSLNQALQGAAEAGDRTGARRASIDILDFADAEQDWLRDHPPAACYADAHAAADTMLEAYAATADAFIGWADAGEGLDGLAAFARALEAAGTAGDALTALGRELETTTCLS